LSDFAQPEPEADPERSLDEPGHLSRAHLRALELARAGGDDAQVLATLRMEFCVGPAAVLRPSRLARSFGRWLADLDDARAAGTLEVLEVLQKTAKGEDRVQATRAAVHLDSRRTKLEAIDAEVHKIVRELLALPEGALVARLKELLGVFERRQVKVEG
jgi:hypothetical protein